MSNTPNIGFHRKRLVYISSLKGRGGGNAVNDCSRPPMGSSKVDLAEFHDEELRSRRHRQLARIRGFTAKPRSSLRHMRDKQSAPQYFEPLPNGGYRTLHPRKGWRIVSPKRLRFFA